MKFALANDATLASVLYFPESRELEVEFQSGEIYRYFSVPPQAYYDLLAAPWAKPPVLHPH